MRGSFSLDTTDLFAGVRPQTLQAAYALLQEKRYRRREMIFFPTALSHYLYLIGQGNVRLYKLSPEGKEITLWVLGPGKCFGELALMDGMPQGYYAEAIEDVWLGMIAGGDLKALVNRDPSLLWAITKLIASRRRDVEIQLADLVFKSVPSRLATFLLQQAEKHGNEEPQGIFNGIKLTHQDIANRVGTAREVTTLILNKFKRAGVLDFDRWRMFIRDGSRLERIAMGETEHAVAEGLGTYNLQGRRNEVF